jgi:hypothetical protein
MGKTYCNAYCYDHNGLMKRCFICDFIMNKWNDMMNVQKVNANTLLLLITLF